MTDGPDSAHMKRAYEKWAPIYDIVYDKLTEPAARRAVGEALKAGPRVLEVGVGTGLSLGYYPPTSEVQGIDLSEHMLEKAREKVARRGLTHVKGLQVMDACHLTFPDNSFDAVVAQFVITLVPNPEQALDGFLRVVRPGGAIVLANHFGATGPVLGKLEDAIGPLSRTVGWSAGFKAARIEAWARSRGVAYHGTSPVFPGGFFKVLSMTKEAAAPSLSLTG